MRQENAAEKPDNRAFCAKRPQKRGYLKLFQTAKKACGRKMSAGFSEKCTKFPPKSGHMRDFWGAFPENARIKSLKLR
jgi:hypothetical protein